mgnify:CR=1 FL=1
MIEMRGDCATAGQRLAMRTLDDEPVIRFFQRYANLLQCRGHGGEAVAFLDAQFLEAAGDGGAFGGVGERKRCGRVGRPNCGGVGRSWTEVFSLIRNRQQIGRRRARARRRAASLRPIAELTLRGGRRAADGIASLPSSPGRRLRNSPAR